MYPTVELVQVLLLLVASTTGFETHLTNRRCDGISEGYGYLELAEDEAGPFVLSTTSVNGERPKEVLPGWGSGVPLWRESVVAFHDDIIAYTDTLTLRDEREATIVKVTELENTLIPYMNRESFQKATTPVPVNEFFGWSEPDQWKAYKKYGTDTRTITLTYSSNEATDVTTDGTSVAWVDRETPTSNWDVMLYTQTDSRYHAAGISHPSSDSDIHRLSPKLCRGRLLYIEYAESTKTSRLVSYDVGTGDFHVHYNPLPDQNILFLDVWSTPGEEGVECQFVWGSYPHPVYLHEAVPGLLSHDDLYSSQLSIVVERYPGATFFRFTVAELSSYTTSCQLPDPIAATSVAGGGSNLFITLGFTCLYSVDVSSGTGLASELVTFINSYENQQIFLQFALPGAVVYGSSTKQELVLVKTADTNNDTDTHVPLSHRTYECYFDTTDRIAGYYDTVIVRSLSDPSKLEKIDLDKDNDGLYDKQDRFPKETEFTWDEDNDGVADEEDLFHVSGDCTYQIETDPGTCMGDIPVMWMVWGGVTMVLIIVTTAIFRARESLLAEGRLVEAEILEEDEEEKVRDAIVESGTIDDKRSLYNVIENEIRDLKSRMSLYNKLEDAAQVFLLLLTLFSVLLVIVPVWEKTRLPTRTLSIFTWIDIYTATLFAIDLVFRWLYRDDKSMTFAKFFKENWFDFPSLACDLPGFEGSTGNLDLLVLTRLFRIIRILKIFRIMRLYRKVTNQSAYLSLVLHHGKWMLPIVALLLLITIAGILKIIEQDEQEIFESYWHCLWFCFVTATTVGYGDMTPQQVLGRILACVLMICGIGMIGNITARVSSTIAKTGYLRAKEKEREERHEDHPAVKLSLLELSVPFNPMVVLKDFRHEYVDISSKQFMSPRYLDAAVHQSHRHSMGKKEAWEQGERERRVSMGGSSLASSHRSGVSGVSGASSCNEWSSVGVKGATIYGVYRKLKSAHKHISPKQLARGMKLNPEFRRLQRSLAQYETTSLDEFLSNLGGIPDEHRDKVNWELLEEQLIQTTDYHRTIAKRKAIKSKQLDWDYVRWNDYPIVQKMRAMRKQRQSQIPKCMDKLFLVILRFKLDEGYKHVDDWHKMYQRLAAVIFKKPKKNGLAIEKMFSICNFEDHNGPEEGDPLEQEEYYDWQDPLTDTYCEIENILRQHNVHHVEEYNDILLSIESIAMQFDRLVTTKWALHHLRWGSRDRLTLVPRPPLVEERGKNNTINQFLHVPKAHRCTKVLKGGRKCGKLMRVTRRDAAPDADGHDPGLLSAPSYPSFPCLGERQETNTSVKFLIDDDVISLQDVDDIGDLETANCDGLKCLQNRRLGLPTTDLDTTSYISCPDGHFILCRECATDERARDNHHEIDDKSAGSRSSASCSEMSFGSIGIKRFRPFAGLTANVANLSDSSSTGTSRSDLESVASEAEKLADTQFEPSIPDELPESHPAVRVGLSDSTANVLAPPRDE